MANFIRLLYQANGLVDGEYVEPFAGGASVALSLLFRGVVRRVHINDGDPAIYAFWKAVLEDPDQLSRRVTDATLTVDEWRRQRAIYRDPDADPFDLAFATFYLNRTNRSGIVVHGGLIGGLDQSGTWKMDARFTKPELVRRIAQVARFQSSISLTNLDAGDLLSGLPSRLGGRPALVYLDPPYYNKGSMLYRNFYKVHQDHADLADKVAQLEVPWVVSYDNAPEVRDLYSDYRRIEYGLRYTARERYDGKEIMFFSPGLSVPAEMEPTAVSDRFLVRHLRNASAVEWHPL